MIRRRSTAHQIAPRYLALVACAAFAMQTGVAEASPPSSASHATARPAGGLFSRLRVARVARAQQRVARSQARGLGRPLDRRFVSVGGANHGASHDEYMSRLSENGMRAQFVPLGGEVDPSRPAAFVVIGIGERFEDAHAMASGLEEQGYQVFVSVSDESRAMLDNGSQLAHAATEVMQTRTALAAQRGIRASRDVMIFGHSFGGTVSQLMLSKLHADGAIGAHESATFEHVDFTAVDSPWRGVDVPWVLRVPGAKTAFRALVPHVPGVPATVRSKAAMVVSLMNGSRSMRALAHVQMPAEVTTNFVSVRGKDDTGFSLKYTSPLNNLFTEELFPHEAQRMWTFLQSPRGADYLAGRPVSLRSLDQFVQHGLTRTNGLSNLARTLRRDADFATHAPEIARAAREATSVEDFGRRWNAVLSRITPDLQGQHTSSMWTDSRFSKIVIDSVTRARANGRPR